MLGFFAINTARPISSRWMSKATEWEALQGARRVFSEVKPKLLCEVHDPEQMDQICGFLEGQGYRCEKWNPVDPHAPDYHQLYVWAMPR